MIYKVSHRRQARQSTARDRVMIYSEFVNASDMYKHTAHEWCVMCECDARALTAPQQANWARACVPPTNWAFLVFVCIWDILEGVKEKEWKRQKDGETNVFGTSYSTRHTRNILYDIYSEGFF